MPTGIEIAIEDLENKLNQVRMLLSEKRKAGFDTKIAELHIISVPAKIQIAQATKDQKDVRIAADFLRTVQTELDDAKKSDDSVNLNQVMLEEGSRLREEEIMKKAQKLVSEGYTAMKKGNRQEVINAYVSLREMYKYVPKQMKKEIYPKIMLLRNEIVQPTAKQQKSQPNQKLNKTTKSKTLMRFSSLRKKFNLFKRKKK